MSQRPCDLRELNEFPGTIGNMGVHFRIHRLFPFDPVRAAKCLTDGVGSILRACGCTICLVDGHLEADLAGVREGKDFSVVDIIEIKEGANDVGGAKSPGNVNGVIV